MNESRKNWRLEEESLEECKYRCLDQGSVADAVGTLPTSLWHHQSCFHTHHLLPTTSICDSLPQGFLWPQEYAWPIQGTGQTFGGVNALNQERIEIQCVLPHFFWPSRWGQFWSVFYSFFQRSPARWSTKHFTLTLFSSLQYFPLSYQSSWDRLQKSCLYQIFVSKSASEGTQTEQLATEETEAEEECLEMVIKRQPLIGYPTYELVSHPRNIHPIPLSPSSKDRSSKWHCLSTKCRVVDHQC